MSSGLRPSAVLLGNMTDMPVAGIACLTMPYVVGLERLGFDAYYVESHAIWPRHFQVRENDDGAVGAAAYIDRVMRRFGMPSGRWAYHALHSDGRVYGLSEGELKRLYLNAAVILNLHGGTYPLPEHAESGRLVLIDTDPVGFQVDVYNGKREVIEFLEPHVAFFTWGENFDDPDCRVPQSERFPFHPTRMPILLDFWQGHGIPAGDAFTTIGNWRQGGDEVVFEGELYTWSKHTEFFKFIDLPRRTDQRFELALSSVEGEDARMLEGYGWRLQQAEDVSGEIDDYVHYIAGSRGEFTVAKDQNVRLRSGWFSDRSAAYLAAGRPVITQETGFSNVLPTGDGLFSFSTMDDILAAIDKINSEYERHSRAAVEIAHEYFDAERVLARLLDQLGFGPPARVFPPNLDLTVVSRRPTRLRQETVDAVLAAPLPRPREGDRNPMVSVVIVTHDGLPFTRLCLESLLANATLSLEAIVVDNASQDGTRRYLRALTRLDQRVRVIENERNAGFAAATNQGLAAARGRLLVLLNNDTVAPPGALERLLSHLEDESVGLVGPVSNEAATEAEIDAAYGTYEELFGVAAAREGGLVDVPMVTMFCVALRREVYEQVGSLDERFDLGLFEDDDYCERVRRAGYRVAYAEDALVHHFGEGSFGALVPTGEYSALFEENCRRFEAKWGVEWRPHGRDPSDEYRALVERVREVVLATVPEGAKVLVVSRGDECLLELDGRRAGHFPQLEDGTYAGYYPADSAEAIAAIEALRSKGAEFLVFPKTGFWWLDHYRELTHQLERRYREVARHEDACIVYSLEPKVESGTGCSIVIPVFNKAALTRQCLDAILTHPPEVGFELIVVDDGSTDATQDMLAEYGERVRVVRHSANTGFATACNDGAAIASGEYVVFLNNDTIPQAGWLDRLVEYAEGHPQAAIVGSKLLFPNDTVQHAGIVVCQDRYVRHLYAGFPADHPAVNKSRRFQAVTAACALARRSAFEELGGFNAAFRNGYEDVDLCLRLGDRGHEVHFCHESVLYHLESVSEGRWTHDAQNFELWRSRWAPRVRPDDFEYYIEDGLLRLDYWGQYPLRVSLSPLLAVLVGEEDERDADRLLNVRARQVAELLRENIRLNLRDREAAPAASSGDGSVRLPSKARGREAEEPLLLARGDVHWLANEPSARLVSVIIPVKNGGIQLRELLPRILSQEAPVTAEIVAVDSGSADDSVEVLREFGATVVGIDPRSFNHGATRNLAASYARGDVLVFINQSALPADQRWLTNLLAPLDGDQAVCGVCSRVLPRPDADLLTYKDGTRDPSGSSERQVRAITSWEGYRGLTPYQRRLFINFHTVSAAIRPDVLARLPFREVLMGEDLIWAKEVLEAGLKVQHEPSSVVLHSHAYSYADVLRRNVDDAIANREIVDRRLEDDEVVPTILALVRDDWRYLVDECGLVASELDEWRVASVLRRTAQIVGQWIGANQDRMRGDLLSQLSLTERIKAGADPTNTAVAI